MKNTNPHPADNKTRTPDAETARGKSQQSAGVDSVDPAAAMQSEGSALEELRQEVERLREQQLRAVADARNLQQRLSREKEEALRYAEGNLARELLVILDDLERTQTAAQSGADAQAILQGLKITYEHFLKLLRDHHVEPVAAEGQPFDPDRHEALLREASATLPAGMVVRELARGYKMHDRVLRPARVAVSSGPA